MEITKLARIAGIILLLILMMPRSAAANITTDSWIQSTTRNDVEIDAGPVQVPVPPSVWLFTSGLLGLVAIARFKS